MRYLVKQRKGSTRPSPPVLGVSQRTVERYVKGQLKRPRPDLAARLERRGPQALAAAGPRQGARSGRPPPTASSSRPGPASASPPRPAPPTTAASAASPSTCRPAYAARLFDAQAAGATEQQLQEIAAEGLKEIYFKDSGRRAHGLLVEFTDIDYVDLDY